MSEADAEEKAMGPESDTSSDMTGTRKFKATTRERKGGYHREDDAANPAGESSLANTLVRQLHTSLLSVAETQREQGEAIRQQGPAILALAHRQKKEREITEKGMNDLTNCVKNLSLHILEGRSEPMKVAEKGGSPEGPVARDGANGGWLASQAGAEFARAREGRAQKASDDILMADEEEEPPQPTTPPPKKKHKEAHVETPIKQSKSFGGAQGQSRGAPKHKAPRDEEKQMQGEKTKEPEKNNVYEQLGASTGSKGGGGGRGGGWRQDPFEKSDPWMDTRYAQTCPSFTAEAHWAATWTMQNAMSSGRPQQSASSTDTRSWHGTSHGKNEEVEPPQQPKDKKKNKEKEMMEAVGEMEKEEDESELWSQSLEEAEESIESEIQAVKTSMDFGS